MSPFSCPLRKYPPVRWSLRDWHTSRNLYSNPKPPNCKLPDKVRQSLRPMKGTNSEGGDDSKSNHHFDGLVTLKMNCSNYHHANRTVWNNDSAPLHSVPTSIGFRHPNEGTTDTYRSGPKHTVPLADDSSPMKQIEPSLVPVASLQLPNSMHVDHLNETLISAGHVIRTKQLSPPRKWQW